MFKHMSVPRYAAIVLTLGLALGLMAGCGESAATTGTPSATSAPSATTQPSATSQPTQTVQTAQIGQTVTVGSTWQMAVVNFRAFTPTNRTPPAGTKYVAMEVNVRNVSSQAQNLANTGQFTLRGANGEAYSQVYVGGMSQDLAEMCAPNEQQHAVIAFQVPTTASQFTAAFTNTTTQPHTDYVQWNLHV